MNGEQMKSSEPVAASRKRGRPRIGLGAQVICVSVEQSLLVDADRLARSLRLSRAALISKGLKHMLDLHAERKTGQEDAGAPPAEECRAADTSMIVKVMDEASLASQRDRIEAEVLAYVIVAASRGTLPETLMRMHTAGFYAECFRNPAHRQVFAAVLTQADGNGSLDDASLLAHVCDAERDAASVVLCAIAAFDVVSSASFDRYLEQIRMFEEGRVSA